MRLYLHIRHASGADDHRELAPGPLTIGRGPGNDLDPLDPALSRRHAVLETGPDGLFLEALPTRNGTRLNGSPVEGRVPVRLGDEIRAGNTVLRLSAEDPELSRRRQERTVEMTPGNPDEPVAASTAMARLLDRVARVSASPLPILVTGESGAGKEVVARLLHARSPRSGGPFVVLNCPALSPGLVESELFGVEAGVATGVTAREGLLERADGGTLLLDEVADLPRDVQPKLLRFLQDHVVQRLGGRRGRPVDVRVVAATNHDLVSCVANGTFRADLYYRLAAVTLTVPPLRDRPEDILPLARLFLARAPSRHLTPEAEAALRSYPFPGNVRELEAIIGRASHLCEGPAITEADLGLPVEPGSPRASSHPPEPLGTPDLPGTSDLEVAARLYRALVEGRADFWADVHAPFRRHELSRAVVRELIGLARAGCGTRRVRDVAAHLRVEDQYRKLLDFLRNNELLPDGEDSAG